MKYVTCHIALNDKPSYDMENAQSAEGYQLLNQCSNKSENCLQEVPQRLPKEKW